MHTLDRDVFAKQYIEGIEAEIKFTGTQISGNNLKIMVQKIAGSYAKPQANKNIFQFNSQERGPLQLKVLDNLLLEVTKITPRDLQRDPELLARASKKLDDLEANMNKVENDDDEGNQTMEMDKLLCLER